MENQLTPEQLEAIAKKAAEEKALLDAVAKRHNVPKAYMLKVPLNDEYTEFAIGFIKYPDREDISICMTMKDTDPLKGKEIVLRGAWLEGDDRIKDDTETFLSSLTVLDEVLAVRQAILKKNY